MNQKLTYYIVFDIETTGLHPWFEDRVTCICAKDSQGVVFSYAGEDEKAIINNFLVWLKERSEANYFLITKAGKSFDVPFILARLAQYKHLRPEDLFITRYTHLDIQEITQKRISLSDMAVLFSCSPKAGTGKQAIVLAHEKRFAELEAYCMQDVMTTEEIYQTYLSLKEKKHQDVV